MKVVRLLKEAEKAVSAGRQPMPISLAAQTDLHPPCRLVIQQAACANPLLPDASRRPEKLSIAY